jgi:hypothetical protein
VAPSWADAAAAYRVRLATESRSSDAIDFSFASFCMTYTARPSDVVRGGSRDTCLRVCGCARRGIRAGLGAHQQPQLLTDMDSLSLSLLNLRNEDANLGLDPAAVVRG